MRGVDKAIYDLISSNQYIQAVMNVATKEDVNVYPFQEDVDMIVPCITFEERNSQAYPGIPNCETLTYKIDIWTKDPSDATRIANAMEEMLVARNYFNEYAQVCQFTLFTSADIFEETTGIYHKSLIYKIIAINKEVI